LGDLVSESPSFPCCALILDISNLEGILVDEDVDGAIEGMEGMVSGEVRFGSGDLLTCDGEFTGEFTGEAKIPSGCVSKAELTLDENRDCPAEAILNLCDGVSYLCEIPESTPPGDFPIGNSCVAFGCFTIDCPTRVLENP